jgi:diguanylate cyclase (GGDEF)-like protein/PAS domain S-box-containing protein
MDFFVLDEQLTQLESTLPSQRGAERLRTLSALAWHLCQRDSRRALTLADEAEAMLALSLISETELRRIGARLRLVRGEIRRLEGELDEARRMIEAASEDFEALDDDIGSADACWLHAFAAGDSGDAERRESDLARAASHARMAGDALRADVAEAALARFSVFRDLHGAQAHWGKRFDTDVERLPPALKTWVSDFFGLVGFQSSDFGCAAANFMHTYDSALATGQISRAIVAASNIANSFTNLNDHHAALEWSERGLALARPTHWPLSVGGSMMQTAETLRRLGRLEAAEELLHESLAILGRMPGARDFAIATEYLGDVALDRGDYATALDIFQRQYQHAQAPDQAEFRIGALRGQAHALAHLGLPEEALRAATEALHLAQAHGDTQGQFDALRVLAKVHAQHPLPPPPEAGEGSASLYYLQQAFAMAGSIPGFTVPGELLDSIAQEYAKAGKHVEAYSTLLQANAARDKTHSREATNRAIAMQVQYQTERERAEVEHHRRLAASEAQRAQVLQQTSSTLERLGAIGQEITAHLNATAVFHALDRHVHGLLDAEAFAIYLFDADQSRLDFAFGVEGGMTVRGDDIDMAHPTANSARCVRERREVLIDMPGGTFHPNLIPGTTPMLSQLFAPLQIGDRVLGVMTIQSPRRHAYGERERLIFRTLCAYGAIALDNAGAYRQLEATLKTLGETKAQLEEASVTDPLTGLRNRRFLLQHIEFETDTVVRRYEEERAKRGAVGSTSAESVTGMDLLFFMIDLDHFKNINDTWGHAAGDMVLVQMRERLEEVFRDTDYIVRWGGEEFLIVARSSDRTQAASLAERAHAAVSEREFEIGGGARITRSCSIGFACYPFLPHHPRLLSWSQVVELADQCLYMAKRRGRNGWVGLYGTEAANPESIFQRLMRNLRQVVDTGEVRLAASPATDFQPEPMEPEGESAAEAAVDAVIAGVPADAGTGRHHRWPAPGLVHISLDGRLLRMNQPFCETFGYSEEELLGRSFQELIHPQSLPVAVELAEHIVRNEIQDFSRELRCVRKDGHTIWVSMTVSSMRDRDGRFKPTFIVEDISARKKASEEAVDLATHDALTRLPNRSLLQDRLRQAIAAARQAQKQAAVIVLDLDNFKNINDSLGHEVGDQVLLEAGRRLSSHLRAVDTVARQGDDEFVVVLPNIEDQTAVAVVAQKLLDSLSRPMNVHGHEFFVAGSIGISMYPKDGDDGRVLLKNADAAMHRAKEAGRNSFCFYLQEMNARALDRLKIEGGLRRALERKEFLLHYQPQVDLDTGAIVGAEALIRWLPTGQEMLYPSHFISIAEESGLIVPIGEWVLREACRQSVSWQESGLTPIRIGVNLSAHQFSQQDMVGTVTRILRETGCPPSCLSLEITESVVMKDPQSAVETLQRLSDMGVHLSIDDFGTGYSSLSYLKRFPIDALKIDRSFVSDIISDDDNAAIVKVVIALAHSMKIEVIAEGVETVEQLDFLKRQRCNQMQGYLFSRPVPPVRMAKLLASMMQRTRASLVRPL